MKLIADYHTHSKFSRFGHGKNSIEQMVYYANEFGLRELAITDHGFKHFFRTTKENLKRARRLIDDYNTWSKTKILLGIEADILNERGDLDIDDDVLDLIDVLIVGYHKCIKTDFANFFGKVKNSKSAITKATNAFINCLERYPVTFISHINADLKLDLFKIGSVCKEKNVYIEINNSHSEWSRSQMEALLESGCSFVVNSDAHCSDDIGKVDKAFDVIKRFKIPTSKFANLEFEQEEMTRDEQEFEIYYDMYKEQIEKEKKKVQYEIDNSPSKLSKEMEDELEKLANEQGILNYQRRDGYVDPDKILEDENYKNEISKISESDGGNFDDNELNSQDFAGEIQNDEFENADENFTAVKNSNENLETDVVESKNDEFSKEDYNLENLQENQVEMLIQENGELNNKESGTSENFDNTLNNFFDGDEKSNKFNVNKKTRMYNGSKTTVIVKNVNGNAQLSENSKKSTNQNEKTSNEEKKVTKTRLQNGLVDFSGLKDDD